MTEPRQPGPGSISSEDFYNRQHLHPAIGYRTPVRLWLLLDIANLSRLPFCPLCMAAMRLTGITDLTYPHSNEDGTPFGLSTADIYTDLAKRFDEQSMKIRYVPARLEGRPGLYEYWKQRTRMAMD